MIHLHYKIRISQKIYNRVKMTFNVKCVVQFNVHKTLCTTKKNGQTFFLPILFLMYRLCQPLGFNKQDAAFSTPILASSKRCSSYCKAVCIARNFSEPQNAQFIIESSFKSIAGYNGAQMVYIIHSNLHNQVKTNQNWQK